MGKTTAFVIGGVVGAAAALLLAPRSGAETRAMAAEAANNFISNPTADGASVKEAWNNAVAKGEEFFAKTGSVVSGATGDTYAKVVDAATDAYTKVSEFAGDTFVKASDAAAVAATKAKDTFDSLGAKAQTTVEEEVIPVFTEQDDELRAKMELARQRIAEQIAKNAADAKARAEAIAAAAAEDAANAVGEVAEATKAE